MNSNAEARRPQSLAENPSLKVVDDPLDAFHQCRFVEVDIQPQDGPYQGQCSTATHVADYERIRRAGDLGLFRGGMAAIRALSTSLMDSGV